MKTLVQLLVLAALGYLLWAYGIPWVRSQVGRSRPPVSSPASGPGGTCVQAAARASEELHDRVLDSARPLLDDASWNEVVDSVASALQEARVACDCRLDSCAAARRAVGELAALLESASGQFRASQSVPLELGRRYERVNQELWLAYDLARDGR